MLCDPSVRGLCHFHRFGFSGEIARLLAIKSRKLCEKPQVQPSSFDFFFFTSLFPIFNKNPEMGRIFFKDLLSPKSLIWTSHDFLLHYGQKNLRFRTWISTLYKIEITFSYSEDPKIRYLNNILNPLPDYDKLDRYFFITVITF